MPRKREVPEGLTDEALDSLIAGVKTPEQMEVVFRALKKALVERVLRAELTEHLGYPDGAARSMGASNARNGTTPKTVLTDEGALPLAIPRDRASTFAPQLVPKGVRRLPGFDAKVLSLLRARAHGARAAGAPRGVLPGPGLARPDHGGHR